jgi:hypothetical protein
MSDDCVINNFSVCDEDTLLVTMYEDRLKSSWTGDSAPLLCRMRR